MTDRLGRVCRPGQRRQPSAASWTKFCADVCHVYPFEIADGPANMALDEAILDAVGTGEPRAILRTDGWSVPTLSLGYFQRLAHVQADHAV